jgi:hypothetical protein
MLSEPRTVAGVAFDMVVFIDLPWGYREEASLSQTVSITPGSEGWKFRQFIPSHIPNATRRLLCVEIPRDFDPGIPAEGFPEEVKKLREIEVP